MEGETRHVALRKGTLLSHACLSTCYSGSKVISCTTSASDVRVPNGAHTSSDEESHVFGVNIELCKKKMAGKQDAELERLRNISLHPHRRRLLNLVQIYNFTKNLVGAMATTSN